MTEHTVTTAAIFPLPEDREHWTEEGLEEPAYLQEALQGENRLDAIRLLRMEGFHGVALKALQQIVSQETDHETYSTCYLAAGQVREQLREYQAAAACYEEAASRDPEDREVRYLAHNNLGYCLNRLGRHAQAEECCRRAIEIDGARFNAHKNLGVALEGVGRFAEAAASLGTAVRLRSEDPRALRHLRILVAEHPELGSDAGLIEALEAARRSTVKDASTSNPVDDGTTGSRVKRLLETITISESVAAEGLQVFGLGWEPGTPLEYRTLDEALADGGLEVTEISEQGSVPTIKVINHSEARVFLMAGEQLIGAKQNRVLNASLLLDSRVEMPLPVSCVEQGRWAHRSRRFESSGTSSHSSLRLMMSMHAHEAYRRHGTPTSNQGAVWSEVARLLNLHGTRSRSQALHDAYEKVGDRLKQIRERIPVREHWQGAAFAFGGSIVGLDLFDQPATLAKLWPKLIGAYAIETPREKPRADVSREQVEDWVRSFSRSAVEAFPSPGLGTDVRLEGRRAIGAMLVVDERPLHLEVFADDEM